MKILVVEDHPKIRQNIIDYLKLKGYTAEGALHGEVALEMLHANYDLIVLDMNMPIMDGATFIEQIRTTGYQTPVIVLTSNSLLEDKVTMFDLGADDYVTKPFEMRELEARIVALGRRKEKAIEATIEIGDYTMEVAKRILRKGTHHIELTSKEFGILEYLGRNKSYPKSKLDILEAVWGMREAELAMDSITLEAHISTIRKKLGKNIIQTIKGAGYVIH